MSGEIDVLPGKMLAPDEPINNDKLMQLLLGLQMQIKAQSVTNRELALLFNDSLAALEALVIDPALLQWTLSVEVQGKGGGTFDAVRTEAEPNGGTIFNLEGPSGWRWVRRYERLEASFFGVLPGTVDPARLEAAITVSSENGEVLHFAAGAYQVDATFLLGDRHLLMAGEGPTQTTIQGVRFFTEGDLDLQSIGFNGSQSGAVDGIDTRTWFERAMFRLVSPNPEDNRGWWADANEYPVKRLGRSLRIDNCRFRCPQTGCIDDQHTTNQTQIFSEDLVYAKVSVSNSEFVDIGTEVPAATGASQDNFRSRAFSLRARSAHTVIDSVKIRNVGNGDAHHAQGIVNRNEHNDFVSTTNCSVVGVRCVDGNNQECQGVIDAGAHVIFRGNLIQNIQSEGNDTEGYYTTGIHTITESNIFIDAQEVGPGGTNDGVLTVKSGDDGKNHVVRGNLIVGGWRGIRTFAGDALVEGNHVTDVVTGGNIAPGFNGRVVFNDNVIRATTGSGIAFGYAAWGSDGLDTRWTLEMADCNIETEGADCVNGLPAWYSVRDSVFRGGRLEVRSGNDNGVIKGLLAGCRIISDGVMSIITPRADYADPIEVVIQDVEVTDISNTRNNNPFRATRAAPDMSLVFRNVIFQSNADQSFIRIAAQKHLEFLNCRDTGADKNIFINLNTGTKPETLILNGCQTRAQSVVSLSSGGGVDVEDILVRGCRLRRDSGTPRLFLQSSSNVTIDRLRLAENDFPAGMTLGAGAGTLTVTEGLSLGNLTAVADFGFRYLTGSGAPGGTVTPRFIGDEYLDTSGNQWHRSHGPTASDWKQIT